MQVYHPSRNPPRPKVTVTEDAAHAGAAGAPTASSRARAWLYWRDCAPRTPHRAARDAMRARPRARAPQHSHCPSHCQRRADTPDDATVDDRRQLAYTCQGCHGIPGYRNAYPHFHVPKIGGQPRQYLVNALQEYKAGDRSHPTMQAQAQSFSDADIADIAAFLSSLQP
jgi:cytochrome c553